MAIVKFTSINKVSRTVTFDVDGQAVTRHIPAVFAGTIDEYIEACANGLKSEFTTPEVKTIDTPTTKAGDVI